MQTYEEIQKGDTVQTDKPTLTFYSPNSYSVMTAIPENYRYLVKENNSAQVYINSLPDIIFKGTVSKIADMTDNTSDIGMTFSSKLSLKNNDTRLRPGLTCAIQFELNKLNDVIVIPTNLLTKRDNKSFVNLRVGENISEKEVIVGVSKDNETWIASGLKEGDVIVPKK